MTAHDYSAIKAALEKTSTHDGYSRHVVFLAQGDKAWNPASTSREIYGPAEVRYTQHVDGSIAAMVIEG